MPPRPRHEHEAPKLHIKCKPLAIWFRVCASDLVIIGCMIAFMAYVLWGVSPTLRAYRALHRRCAAGREGRAAGGEVPDSPSRHPLLVESVGTLVGDEEEGKDAEERQAECDPYRRVGKSLDNSLLVGHTALPRVPQMAAHSCLAQSADFPNCPPRSDLPLRGLGFTGVNTSADDPRIDIVRPSSAFSVVGSADGEEREDGEALSVPPPAYSPLIWEQLGRRLSDSRYV